VFTITSVSSQGTSDEPAVVFHRVPNSGETVPAAPTGVTATPAGEGTVALEWQAPSGTTPDYYQIG